MLCLSFSLLGTKAGICGGSHFLSGKHQGVSPSSLQINHLSGNLLSDPQHQREFSPKTLTHPGVLA